MRRSPLIACVLVLALVLAAPAVAGGSSRKRAVFLWPANGTVTSPYGARSGSFHPGVDIGMLKSLGVHAAAGGAVVATGYAPGFEGYGDVVVVDIGDGYDTIYAHLSHASVRVGDVIAPGDPIGTAGCTGRCYGTHLHFEVRLDGKPIDPMPFLGR